MVVPSYFSNLHKIRCIMKFTEEIVSWLIGWFSWKELAPWFVSRFGCPIFPVFTWRNSSLVTGCLQVLQTSCAAVQQQFVSSTVCASVPDNAHKGYYIYSFTFTYDNFFDRFLIFWEILTIFFCYFVFDASRPPLFFFRNFWIRHCNVLILFSL